MLRNSLNWVNNDTDFFKMINDKEFLKWLNDDTHFSKVITDVDLKI